MNQIDIQQLRDWAAEYNRDKFIHSDPVQFPHRYSEAKDIEISAFLTAWISYGNRKCIITKAEELDRMFGPSPLHFILNNKYSNYQNNYNSFYRFFKYHDLYEICERMHYCYQKFGSLESALKSTPGQTLVQRIQNLFININGIPKPEGNSACKRICMFLRWMIRQDKTVDFGIWESFSPSELIVPLDTHVHQIAKKCGITQRSTPDIKTAMEITDFMKQIFPEDPCLGDFALFGYGINNK